MDLSRHSCRDHYSTCDRCSTCRSGRCCARDRRGPSEAAIDATTNALVAGMKASVTEPMAAPRERVVIVQAPPPALPSPPAPAKPKPKKKAKKASTPKAGGSTHVIWMVPDPQTVSPPLSEADLAIRARQRQTRERWAAERATRPPAADDDIVDAEIVDDDVELGPTVEINGLPPAVRAALPPGTPADAQFRVLRDRKGVRDGRPGEHSS